MAGNQDRRRKALERKATKRKEHKRAQVRTEVVGGPVGSGRQLVRAGARWPLYECWINRDWNGEDGESGLAEMLVARRGPAGEIGAGVFLADLGCLGVKNAYARVFPSEARYADFFEHLDTAAPLTKTDLDLVAKVVWESIAYAKRWGFRPHQGFYEAAPFLEGAEPERCAVAVPLGREGKPFYVAGPRDNPKWVISQLMRTAGEGNFDYVVPVSAREVKKLKNPEDSWETVSEEVVESDADEGDEGGQQGE